MEVKEIIELMKAMSENGMTGFELAEGDWKLSMKREKKIVAAAQTPVVMQVPGQTMIQTADVTAMEQVSGETGEKKMSGISEKVINCPLVGTFYSSPAPDAEDYVKVGDTVKKGEAIAICYAGTKEKLNRGMAMFESSIWYSKEAPRIPKLIVDIIR